MTGPDTDTELDRELAVPLDLGGLPPLPEDVWLRAIASALDPQTAPGPADLVPDLAPDLLPVHDGPLPTDDQDEAGPSTGLGDSEVADDASADPDDTPSLPADDVGPGIGDWAEDSDPEPW